MITQLKPAVIFPPLTTAASSFPGWQVGSIRKCLSTNDHIIKVRLIIDRTTAELFANDGIIRIANYFVNKDKVSTNLSIRGKKDLAGVSVKSYLLKLVYQ